MSFYLIETNKYNFAVFGAPFKSSCTLFDSMVRRKLILGIDAMRWCAWKRKCIRLKKKCSTCRIFSTWEEYLKHHSPSVFCCISRVATNFNLVHQSDILLRTRNFSFFFKTKNMMKFWKICSQSKQSVFAWNINLWWRISVRNVIWLVPFNFETWFVHLWNMIDGHHVTTLTIPTTECSMQSELMTHL